MTNQKKKSFEVFTCVVALILTVIGTGAFLLSYTTNYYTYGQMNSTRITICLTAVIVLEIANIILRTKCPDKLWTKYLIYGVISLLAYCAMSIIGDRVEAIGTTIITDYDSGHGGEEAIYYSLGGVALLLIAMVYSIRGSFESIEKQYGAGKRIAAAVIAAVLCVCVVVPVLNMTHAISFGGGNSGKTDTRAGGTYTISLNQQNGNVEENNLPYYQFLSNDLGRLLRAESRLYVDITLSLDGNGNYDLFSDCYVIDSGKRAVVGDDTGMGLVYTTKAEGTYVNNGDGTYTTSIPTHAVAEIKTDTYSSQMRSFLSFGDHDEDGVFDPADVPEVLDFVPETIWTLANGTIINWTDANAGGTYTISLNQQNGNVDEDNLPDYQFLSNDLGRLLRAESRLYVDITLSLDGNGKYDLFSDCYVIDSGKRAVVGDDTGMGLVYTTNAEGSYIENSDGTYTICVPDHAVAEIETDTYSSQMRSFLSFGDHDEDGVFDSADVPEVLDFVPETVFTLDKETKAIISWLSPTDEEEEEAVPASASVSIPSDDGGTEMVFNADGTYVFKFADYGIEDAGTYAYENGVLTLTNANGTEVTAEDDPLKLHYVSAVSDQLTGDFTIPAASLIFEADTPAEKEPEEEAVSASASVSIPSDDGGTEMVFNADGTYVFKFADYGIEDAGTYAYENGVLTLTNANGTEVTAEDDPLKLHYVSAVSDQLTGDFTIPAEIFGK